jgi:hypothetical protein
MAITRAQQVKQMLREGGRIGFQGGGADLGTVSTSNRSARDNREIGRREAATQRAAAVARSAAQQDSDYQSAAYDSPPMRTRIQDEQQEEFRRKQIKDLVDKQQEEKAFEPFETLIVKPSDLPGPGGAVLNATVPFRQSMLNTNVDFYRFDPRAARARAKYGLDAIGYQNYMRDRLAGNIDAAGNTIMGQDDDDNQPIIPIQTGIMTQDSGITDQETDKEEEEPFERALAFRADGGRVGAMGGGIMGGLADGHNGS